MIVLGDITVTLPFTLDFCAKGPDIEPIVTKRGDLSITLFFPPSMSDGTVGKSFFSSGWAWWVGSTLRLSITQSVENELDDVNRIHEIFNSAVNDTLRIFLNSYRVRCRRPDIYPVLANPGALSLQLQSDDGRLLSLPEPELSFFYQKLPMEAPLEISVNATTLASFADDLATSTEQPIAAQTLLDIQFLASVGEKDRAELLMTLLPAELHTTT